MDRGAWGSAVYRVTESDTTERHTHTPVYRVTETQLSHTHTHTPVYRVRQSDTTESHTHTHTSLQGYRVRHD